MFEGLVHREPLQGRLLASNDHVHVITAAQAVIGHGEQAIGVRRARSANFVATMPPAQLTLLDIWLNLQISGCRFKVMA